MASQEPWKLENTQQTAKILQLGEGSERLRAVRQFETNLAVTKFQKTLNYTELDDLVYTDSATTGKNCDFQLEGLHILLFI